MDMVLENIFILIKRKELQKRQVLNTEIKCVTKMELGHVRGIEVVLKEFLSSSKILSIQPPLKLTSYMTLYTHRSR